MADRGSERLLGRCEPLSSEVLATLGDLINEHGARLVGWECLGQPAPDVVRGVAHVDELDTTLELVRSILDLEPRFTAELFPFGIPPFPEFIELRFGTQQLGR